ncbi:Ribosome biogenesis protein erb1 [Coemansia sp. Benny D115]|nr:Ribosome biogenesis protein erb1 [Coemansia sp. Benny D115]
MAGKVNTKAAGKKRTATSRDETPRHSKEEEEVFPETGLLEMSSDSEYDSDEDDEDVAEGDFEAALRKMAEEQGFDSGNEDEDEEGDENEEDEEGDEDEIRSSDIDGASSDEGDEIRSSDIDGASSDEGEDEDEGINESDSESDGEDSGLVLARTNSTSTAGDGQTTEVDSGDEDANKAGDEVDSAALERLSIRDFGKDLEGWKAYRQTLPQIEAGYASDSSTEEPENTIGNVPIEWYEDYPHIGYDIDGKRIMRPATQDELDRFLDNMDNPDVFRTARDETMQRDVTLSAEEIDIIRRIQGGSIPDASYDPYEPTVEWFTSQTMKTPLSSAPLTKTGFIPSRWEHKRVMKIVRAIRKGLITAGPPRATEPRLYDVWENADAEPSQEPQRGRPRLAAPRLALPTHAESYHPPAEYLPTQEERDAWEAADPEDRRTRFLPQDFGALRAVPAYSHFVDERFQRCLDLYLAPRMLKKTTDLNIDELVPRLPDPRDLRPFPAAQALVYEGHTGRVRTISIDPTGLWLLSGSDDGTVRLWELVTGRCARIWTMGATVHTVAWCPNPDVCVFAVAAGSRVAIFVPSELCDDTKRTLSEELVRSGYATAAAAAEAEAVDDRLPVSWDMPTSAEQSSGMHVVITMHKTAKSVAWHRRGDYLATLTAEEGGSAVLIHQLSRHKSQRPFRSLKGAVQCIRFHPTRPWFLVATQRYVRIYNLMQQALLKTLVPGARWISSIDVHPQGDNVIVGSYDKKMSWFDLDLSVKPYKSIRYHRQAIRQVQFSRRFPLFATASDDGSIQVYHAMVYQDLNLNPLIVPLKILRGHDVRNSLGVLDCVFHPIQPWLLSSGADGTIRLWT